MAGRLDVPWAAASAEQAPPARDTQRRRRADEQRAVAALYPSSGRVTAAPIRCPIHTEAPAPLTTARGVTKP